MSTQQERGTVRGCMPRDADNADVRAALDVLDGVVHLAVLDDGYDGEDDAYADVRGAWVTPYTPGTVRVYWIEDGQYRGMDDEAAHRSALGILGNTMCEAGWAVGVSVWLEVRRTDTPTPAPAAPSAAPESGERLYDAPTEVQAAELAELLGVRTLRHLGDLATLADLHAGVQDGYGAKAWANQYRLCAHQIRQAHTIHAHDADQAGAHLAAAIFHAREADPNPS